jgi:cytochrome c peroxidase
MIAQAWLLPVALAALSALRTPGVQGVSDEFPAQVPYGLPEPWVEPASNPGSAASYVLGRRLFFDTRLSIDHSVSCASCHQPAHGFADPAPLSQGALGRRTLRHAPALLNRGFGTSFFWDGRVATLEEQVLRPIEEPTEMALPLEQALERMRQDAALRAAFEAAYPEGLTRASLAKALATFVRRQWLGDSPIDRFQRGDYAQLSELERIGLWTFEGRGRCWQCHSGGNYTDEAFHNTGVGVREGQPEPGRLAATGRAADRGAFKTPSLRGVALSAPYMHDGSLATLEDVVAFYRRGGNANPDLDSKLAPLDLTEREAQGLAHFLQALSRAAE